MVPAETSSCYKASSGKHNGTKPGGAEGIWTVILDSMTDVRRRLRMKGSIDFIPAAVPGWTGLDETSCSAGTAGSRSRAAWPRTRASSVCRSALLVPCTLTRCWRYASSSGWDTCRNRSKTSPSGRSRACKTQGAVGRPDLRRHAVNVEPLLAMHYGTGYSMQLAWQTLHL